MHRWIACVVALVAFAGVAPAAIAGPEDDVGLSRGRYEQGAWECDRSRCGGWLVLTGTFAVGEVQVDDVARFEWLTDPGARHVARGAIQGEHLAGTCVRDGRLSAEATLAITPGESGISEPTVACDVSADGGPVQPMWLELVGDDPVNGTNAGVGTFLGSAGEPPEAITPSDDLALARGFFEGLTFQELWGMFPVGTGSVDDHLIVSWGRPDDDEVAHASVTGYRLVGTCERSEVASALADTAAGAPIATCDVSVDGGTVASFWYALVPDPRGTQLDHGGFVGGAGSPPMVAVSPRA